MPNRDKYIDLLKQIVKAKDTFYEKEDEIPIRISYQCINDILDMLIEQSPVEYEMEGGGSHWFPVCGECHGVISDHWKYCPECGRRIKWDG